MFENVNESIIENISVTFTEITIQALKDTAIRASPGGEQNCTRPGKL
jgi:hypothetical protein